MIYMEGSHVIISKKKNIFLSLKTVFVLANSVDSDKVPHYTDLSGSSPFAKIHI